LKRPTFFPSLAFLVLFIAVFASAREKITVAVMDFEAKNVSRENAEGITDILRTELFNTGCFRVVERQQIQRILEEQKFQMSGLTDPDQATELGRLLNVRKIMTGTVTLLGSTHIINTKILDVQSGQMELAEAVECRGGESELPNAITELALKVSYKIGLEGNIIRLSGESVYIDLGSADGLKLGQMLEVVRLGESITDLEGRVIGTNSERIGSLVITKIQDRFSETAVKSKTTLFRKGDRVKPTTEEMPEEEPIEETPPPKKKSPPTDGNKPSLPPVF
jgi:TolB-like protein